jgi:hypothetical protein
VSYLTVEVEIDHARVSSKGGESLPEKASGLLTILHPTLACEPRPVGLAKGEFTVPDDFNAPLPEDVLRALKFPNHIQNDFPDGNRRENGLWSRHVADA